MSPTDFGEPAAPVAREKTNIPSLTGIRGVAALMVLLYHTPLSQVLGLSGSPLIIRNGAYGVDLFFVLSGFILGHVHMDDFRHITRDSVKRFAILRFFRVYPLHLIVLLAIAAWVICHPAYVAWVRTLPGSERQYTLGAFLQTLTLTNQIGLPSLGDNNAPSWSLSSEMVGYFAFPLIAWGVLRADNIRLSLAFIVLSLAAYVVTMSAGHAHLTRMIFCFPAGVVMAHLVRLRRIAPSWAPLLTAISAFVILSTLAVDQVAPLSVVGFSGIVIGLALSDRGTVSRLLSSSPVMFLGRISFSLYLTHLTVQLALIWVLWGGEITRADPVLSLPLLLVSNLVVATAAYTWIELPSHRVGRAIAAKASRREVKAEPTTVRKADAIGQC